MCTEWVRGSMTHILMDVAFKRAFPERCSRTRTNQPDVLPSPRTNQPVNRLTVGITTRTGALLFDRFSGDDPVGMRDGRHLRLETRGHTCVWVFSKFRVWLCMYVLRIRAHALRGIRGLRFSVHSWCPIDRLLSEIVDHLLRFT